jgi:hypothetical protein
MAGNDSYTKLLLHMDGSDEGTTFTDDSASSHTITPDNSDTFTWNRPNGSDIGEGWEKELSGDPDNTITINGNKVRLFSDSDTTPSYSMMKSTFDLSGDFDIQIDYSVVSMPTPTSGENLFVFKADAANTGGGANAVAIQLYRSNATQSISRYIHIDGVFDDQGAVGVNLSTSKFRITRSGSTITVYYDNSGWQQASQWSSAFTGDIISVKVYTYTSSSDDVTVDADNFVINSVDTLVNPPSPVTKTDEKKFGTAAGYFGGNVSYLTAPDSDDWDFGTGPFTIDCWVNLSDIGKFNPIVLHADDSVSGWMVDVNTSNYPRLVIYIDSSWQVLLTSDTALEADTWYHVAVVRNGSNFYLFLDGSEVDSTTNAGAILYSSELLQVGHIETSAAEHRYLAGHVDELRISKGTARWTTDFDVPTGPYSTTTYSIGGTLNNSARIIVINESDWSIEENSVEIVGTYEITTTSGAKTVMARADDGEILVYGSVTPTDQ